MGKHVKRHPRNMRYLKARLRDSPEIFESARMQTIRMLPSIGARELSNVAHGKSQEDARRRLWPERRFIASHNMNQRSAPHHPCAQHRSIFVAGWRPFVGWTCGIALAWHFVLAPLTMFVCAYIGVTIPELPTFDVSSLLTVLMGMLGLGGLRTFEKTKGIAK